MPNKSIADWTDFDNAQRSSLGIDQNKYLFIAFRNSKLGSGRDDVVPLPAAALWCLIRPGDEVLIGQGVDPHYTMMAKVDRVLGRIAFADRWPVRFPLLPDRAEIASADELVLDRKLVATTRDTFMRSVVGITTLTSADALRVLSASPLRASLSPAACFAFGQSYLRADNDRFVPAAVEAFQCALRDARATGESALEVPAANRLHFGLLLQYYRLSAQGDGAMANKAYEEAEALRTKENKHLLIDSNSAADFERLGRAALVTGPSGARWAETYFGESLSRDPGRYSALVLRASLRLQQGQLQAVVDDSTRAVALAGADRDATRRKAADLDPRDPTGREELDRHLQSIVFQRNAALRLQAHASAKLNQPDVALPAIAALRKENPADPSASHFEGLLMGRRGCPVEAAMAFKQALLQHPASDLRREIEHEMSMLDADDRKCVPL